MTGNYLDELGTVMWKHHFFLSQLRRSATIWFLPYSMRHFIPSTKSTQITKQFVDGMLDLIAIIKSRVFSVMRICGGDRINLSLHKSTWKPFSEDQEIQDITEGLIARVMKETKGIEVTPFPHGMNYDDAISLYGSDKPDTRLTCCSKTWQACQGCRPESLLKSSSKGDCCQVRGSITPHKDIDQSTSLRSNTV